MNFVLVTVALIAFQLADGGVPTDGTNAAELSAGNRDEPQGASNGEGTEANGERRICRRIPTSRTHMYRRVCLTARQWRDYDEG